VPEGCIDLKVHWYATNIEWCMHMLQAEQRISAWCMGFANIMTA